MGIGSIGSSAVSSPASGLTERLADRLAGRRTAEAAPEVKTTIADHVAALDEQEPIRSATTTQGTMVDTYL